MGSRQTGRLMEGQAFKCDCFTEPRDFDGFVKDGSTRDILICSHLTEAQLKHAIAHELRHIQQKKIRGVTDLDDPDECDRDAYSYDAEAVARYDKGSRRLPLGNEGRSKE